MGVLVLEGEEQTAVRGLLLWAPEVRQTSGHAEVHEHPPATVESHAKRFLPWQQVILKVCSFRVLCNVRAEAAPSIFSLRNPTDRIF